MSLVSSTLEVEVSRISVLRIRPSGELSDGYTRDQLTAIVRAIDGVSAVGQVETIEFATTIPIGDKQTTERIASAIRRVASMSTLIVVDICFDLTASSRAPQHVDALLSEAINASLHAYSDETLIVILVNSLPTKADNLFSTALAKEVDSRVWFIAQDGELWGAWPEDAIDRVVAHLGTDWSERRHAVRTGTLRRRGLFSSESAETPGIYLFSYEPQARARDALAELLGAYFDRHEIELVVIDSSNASSWFRSTVTSAILAPKTRAITIVDRVEFFQVPEESEDQDRVEWSRHVLESEGSRVCFLTPAFDTGRTMQGLVDDAAPGRGVQRRYLSIFYNEARGQIHSSEQEITCSVRRTLGGEPILLDVICPVEFRVLRRDDWKHEFARNFHEHLRRSSADTLRDFSETSGLPLLSLLEDIGAGKERPVPKGRSGVRFFPRLSLLGEWDAAWLAEMLIKEIESETGKHRDSLALVMPREVSENGGPALSRAMEERTGVPVVHVSRDAIESRVGLSAKEKQDLDTHTSSYLVAFDESAIRGKTLQMLKNLVEQHTGRTVDHTAVVVHAHTGVQSERDQITSLISWKPRSFTPIWNSREWLSRVLRTKVREARWSMSLGLESRSAAKP